MTNLILKHYKRKTANANHICNNCNQVIKKYYEYMKNDEQGLRLHIICFNELSLKAISRHVDELRKNHTKQ